MKQNLNQLKEQLGWQGMAGIALLLLAGAFQTLSLKPLEEETAFMRSRFDAARSNSSSGTTKISSGDRREELAAFFDSLPEENDVTDILASIYAVAEATGVGLKQAEYNLDDRNRPRMEYVMNFPIQGEYPRIRVFLSRVLADHHAMALDQINFQRDRINEPILRANIQLTLFLNHNAIGHFALH